MSADLNAKNLNTNKPRRFSRKQKLALYWLSGGKCNNCGELLRNNWHADHIVHWSMGGDTDVQNGQALCPQCNLEKGVNQHDIST